MADLSDEIGRKADQSDWVDHGVRAGLVAYGIVYLLVGWLALQLALGDRSGTVSSKGALHQLAGEPLGLVLIWLVAIGMVLLVLWRLLELVGGHRDEDGAELWRKRAVDVLKIGLYGTLALSAFSVALGAKGGGSNADTYSAKLMSLPFGPWLVGAVGLAIIGYGVAQIWRGLSEKHAKHLAAEGKSGDAGLGVPPARQGRLRVQGSRDRPGRRTLRLRRGDPRPEEVRWAGRRAAAGAEAAVRSVHAGRHRRRPDLLRTLRFARARHLSR